jgi:hypothetical protein
MTTQLQSYAPLALSRTVLRLLVKLNLLMGVFILALFVASVLWGGFVMRALGVRPGADSGALILGMRVIMVIGLMGIPVANVVLTRLLAIVETVGVGDPFVVENAARLQTIAWAVVGLELMHIAVHVVAGLASAGTQKLGIGDWNFSATPWLTILLLFVLARVFDQGARMRDELAATV